MRGDWPGFLFPELRQSRKVKVRIVRNNACTALKGQLLELRRDDDTGRSGLLQMGLVFGVTEETQVTRTRCFERGQLRNGSLWTAVKAAA